MNKLTTFESLAALIGTDRALNLCEQYGGITIYLPKTTPQSGSLAEHWRDFFGPEAMDKLRANFGGERCYIPKAPPALQERRNDEIFRRATEGESLDVLAADFNITPRYAYVIYARKFSENLSHHGEGL